MGIYVNFAINTLSHTPFFIIKVMSLCKHCSTELPVRRYRPLTFCDRSCAAQHNNQTRKSDKQCVVCGGHVPPRRKQCCSAACRDSLYFATHTDVRVEQGEVAHRQTLRKYLVRKHGYACASCGLSTWLGQRLPLEVDHIDGNATNNIPTNLRLLCCNCHSITPTWKARNKGNGRQSRGLRSC